MAEGIVNGRRIEFPKAVTPEEIARAAGIPAGRKIIQQDYKGNYPMKPGQRINVKDGDKFVDAPPRVKGN